MTRRRAIVSVAWELVGRPQALYHQSFGALKRMRFRAWQPNNPNPESNMSIDKSLKRKGGMARARCVLTRAERIAKMMEDGKWTDSSIPFGLPKTRVQKIVLKKKAKKEAAEGDAAAAAPGAAPAAAAPAAGGKPAAGAKK
jgi:small basic protein (TIGR04137 family)